MATLTEKELFQRFLDAPMRFNLTTSTLVHDDGELITPRDWFVMCFPEAGVIDPHAFADTILEEVELREASERAMDDMAEALEDAARMLRRLSFDFRGVKDVVTLACDENDGSTRYVLPVVTENDEKAA
ncbi:hypothetical protein [Paracoccus sp. MKU1]|uniref:hypothetical protein n=1 Tax=Paracoccus sp. MKU1 TaxID=1745182 RepID=UPI0007192CA0|nr:hypothetical protein [Paracoccus sp. MKU1]KRW96243.1 hypothetical protein AQY21_10185 [Paracoccus sp. MKU1]